MKSYTHPWKNFANKLHLVLHACEILFSKSARKIHVKTKHRPWRVPIAMANGNRRDRRVSLRCEAIADAPVRCCALARVCPARAAARHLARVFELFFSSLVIITRTYAWLKWRCVPVRDWVTRVFLDWPDNKKQRGCRHTGRCAEEQNNTAARVKGSTLTRIGLVRDANW